MDTLVERCAGLDVHKDSVTACVRVPDSHGGRQAETRRFTTTTAGLMLLAEWLASFGVTRVGMESTGCYWKPWPMAQPSAPVDHRPVEVGLALLNLPACTAAGTASGVGSGQGSAARARCSSKAAATACTGLVKTLKVLSPSPLALTRRPPWSATACDTRRSWRARAPPIAW